MGIQDQMCTLAWVLKVRKWRHANFSNFWVEEIFPFLYTVGVLFFIYILIQKNSKLGRHEMVDQILADEMTNALFYIYFLLLLNR